MKIYQTAPLALLLATTSANAEKWNKNWERPEIHCGGVTIGGTDQHIFSRSDNGRTYREYTILKVDGNKTLAKTKYGTVTVSLTDIPTVVWINTKGETAIQVCSYIDQKPLSEPKLATTPANRDPWTVLVNEVVAISAKQNKGTPSYVHFCEPEFKTCSDVVEYTNIKGVETAIQSHTDIKGAVIDRLVCELNKNADVRTCIDFDTHEKTTSMKDIKGKWENIEAEDDQ